jgi:homogentisate 1,2-dioxygenase
MPFYVKRGTLPDKRHIQHRSNDGQLYYEELISREGFSDIYSNVYHLRLPTRVSTVGAFTPIPFNKTNEDILRHRHWRTFKLTARGNMLSGRRYLAYNSDVALATIAPTEPLRALYRNAHADELHYIHRGSGTLHTNFGTLAFFQGDYIVIPRGVISRFEFDNYDDIRIFLTETAGPIAPPKRYYNQFGQLLEHSPYSERDIRVPEFTAATDKQEETELLIKTRKGYQSITMAHHPFDLVGWDGFYFPWILNIKDFMPQVGKVHLPPPVHQTFAAPGLVVCSFVPRLFDFHPQAIPAPYNHSNVDSDEVLYYAEGDFMSRKGVETGSITLHPMGLPHGPQPGKIEASIGKQKTDEYAVMVDTFRPLIVLEETMAIDDTDYPMSWMADENN